LSFTYELFAAESPLQFNLKYFYCSCGGWPWWNGWTSNCWKQQDL